MINISTSIDGKRAREGESAETSRKKEKVGYCRWTEEQELFFVRKMLLLKAHLRDGTSTVKSKFEQVHKALVESRLFNDLKESDSFNPDMLYAKWRNLSKTIAQRTATFSEGANLSGLPEEKPEIVSLVQSMIEEAGELTNHRKEKSNKAKKMEKSLLTHESSIQGIRVHVASESSVEECNSPDSSLSSSSSSGKKSSYQPAEFSSTVLNMLRPDPRLIDLEIEERKQKLEENKIRVEKEAATLQLILKLLNKE